MGSNFFDLKLPKRAHILNFASLLYWLDSTELRTTLMFKEYVHRVKCATHLLSQFVMCQNDKRWEIIGCYDGGKRLIKIS